MTGKGASDGDDSTADSLLRAIAHAPEELPREAEPDPERLAHFRVLARLGAGGMGVVFKARDEKLQRDVALKVLPSAFASDPERRRRLLQEARSAAALTHPNIAAIYDVGEADGRVFLAMELVEGETLRARLARGVPPLDETLRIARQILGALARAHSKGIVHRDLKPDNVMLDEDGEVKVLDFGLAKLRERDGSGSSPSQLGVAETALSPTQDGRVVGTPGYMAPEQAKGVAVDARADVFAFGVVVYEMLSGERPFAGATPFEVMVAVERDLPTPIEKRNPAVAAELAALVARCLVKAPAERFADASGVAAALDAVPPARTAPPRVRRTLRGTLALGAAAAVVGIVTLGIRGRSPGPPTAAASAVSASGAAPTASGARRAEASSGIAEIVAPYRDDPRRSPEAVRLFELALESVHAGLGQEVPLLERAVLADPGFGGADLRLWHLRKVQSMYSGGLDERRRLLPLLPSLSARDRVLFDALDAADVGQANAQLDNYLARYSNDDFVWCARLDGTRPVRDRALAARPGLPCILVEEVVLRRTDNDAAAVVVDRCLSAWPHAVDCLLERAVLLNDNGECNRAEVDVRTLLDLQPGSRFARPLLAGILAARSAPRQAVVDALGDPAQSQMHTPSAPEAVVPTYDGDLQEATRISREAFSRVPSSDPDQEHYDRLRSGLLAATEAGDLAGAAQLAADYRARRAAWPVPCALCDAESARVIARGGRMPHAAADARVASAFAQLVSEGETASRAWAMTYAASAQTVDEARAAVAKLDELATAPPKWWEGAIGRALFLSGRHEAARPILVGITRACSARLDNTLNWVHAHLYLGEIDAERGDTASACAHFVNVITQWGHAKPRSVSADEARTHATRLGCAL